MVRLCALVVLSVLGTVACSQDARDFAVTEQNKDTYLDDVKEHTLTVDDARLLIAAEMRRSATSALGGEAPTFVGKTIGQIVDEERTRQADAKAKQTEQERLAAEAKAKADALSAELRKAINLTAYEKSFSPANFQASRYEDHIVVRFAYENTSGKDIRAFQGAVEFTDLFGAPIYSTNLTISEPVPAGGKGTWAGQIEYNQFIDQHQRFRAAALQDMRVNWNPASIIFADGSRVGETAQ